MQNRDVNCKLPPLNPIYALFTAESHYIGLYHTCNKISYFVFVEITNYSTGDATKYNKNRITFIDKSMIFFCAKHLFQKQCLTLYSQKIYYMPNQYKFRMGKALTFCSSIMLLSSDHILFIIEKIRSTSAYVSGKQNTNSTSFQKFAMFMLSSIKAWNNCVHFCSRDIVVCCHLNLLSLADT